MVLEIAPAGERSNGCARALDEAATQGGRAILAHGDTARLPRHPHQQRPEHGHDEAKQGKRRDRLDQREAARAAHGDAAHRTTRTRPALDMVTWRFEGPAAIVTVRGRVATPVGDTVTLASGQESESIWNSVIGPERPALIERAGGSVANLDGLVDAVAGDRHRAPLPAGQREAALEGQRHQAGGPVDPGTAKRLADSGNGAEHAGCP